MPEGLLAGGPIATRIAGPLLPDPPLGFGAGPERPLVLDSAAVGLPVPPHVVVAGGLVLGRSRDGRSSRHIGPSLINFEVTGLHVGLLVRRLRVGLHWSDGCVSERRVRFGSPEAYGGRSGLGRLGHLSRT